MATRAKGKAPKKGVAGRGTGGTARKAIRAAKKRGASTPAIARAARRKPSTINNIASGNIKNPPKNLAKNVRKAKSSRKRK